MSIFGLWLGSGNGVNEKDPKKDQYGRQQIFAKGTEQPMFGGKLYYFLVHGKKGRYYVNKAMYDKLNIGDWANLI